jgi:hypothetical protein
MSENKTQSRISGRKREEMAEGWRNLHNNKPNNYSYHYSVDGVVKENKMERDM